MNLRECNLCFLDTETGGLDPDRHALLEVGIVKVNFQLEVVAEFESFVCPPEMMIVEPSALGVNKLDLGEVRTKGLKEAELVKGLAPFMAGTVVVGHNVAFDWAFLRALFSRAGAPLPNVSYHRVDTVSLAWPLLLSGAVPKINLKALCEYFGVSNEGEHRALADARRTLQVYKRLLGAYQPFVGWV